MVETMTDESGKKLLLDDDDDDVHNYALVRLEILQYFRLRGQ